MQPGKPSHVKWICQSRPTHYE